MWEIKEIIEGCCVELHNRGDLNTGNVCAEILIFSIFLPKKSNKFAEKFGKKIVFWGNKTVDQRFGTNLKTQFIAKFCTKFVYVILFLAFVRLPIYCVYTQFLNKILSFLSFFTFSPALVVSILSKKYQS